MTMLDKSKPFAQVLGHEGGASFQQDGKLFYLDGTEYTEDGVTRAPSPVVPNEGELDVLVNERVAALLEAKMQEIAEKEHDLNNKEQELSFRETELVQKETELLTKAPEAEGKKK